MRTKVMIVVGTRPEAIKTAPVIYELKQHPDKFQAIIVATAQHREMLDQAFSLFNIVPDVDLNLMTSRQTLHSLTRRVSEGMEKTLDEQKPDIVLVRGDTTTVFTKMTDLDNAHGDGLNVPMFRLS